MLNNEEEKSFQKEAFEYLIKAKMIMLDALKGIEGLADTRLSKILISKTTYGVNIAYEFTMSAMAATTACLDGIKAKAVSIGLGGIDNDAKRL
jgi:hypothetical protein